MSIKKNIGKIDREYVSKQMKICGQPDKDNMEVCGQANKDNLEQQRIFFLHTIYILRAQKDYN